MLVPSDREPCILTRFDTVPNTQLNRKDRSFTTLGIVLLELRFGKRLEDHRLWLNPLYTPDIADPMIRQTVACVWLEDVHGEAGEDYARAVDWMLRQAPSVLKGET